MANSRVEGELLIVGGGSVQGFTVEVYDTGLIGEIFLGSSVMDATGKCQSVTWHFLLSVS